LGFEHLFELMSFASLPQTFGRIAVVAVLALGTVVGFRLSGQVDSATKGGVIMRLPAGVGSFAGSEKPLSEGERTVLPKDTEIVKKTYTDPSGEIVNAQIVLSGAEKRSIHRPELCLPAQGWTINRRRYMPVTLSDGRTITVMCDTISRPVEVSPGVNRPLTSVFCYWFVGDGTTTASHAMRILLTSWDRVIHHKNHRWAYIAVSAPVLEGFLPRGKNAAATEEMITEFISRMGPEVMRNSENGNPMAEIRK